MLPSLTVLLRYWSILSTGSDSEFAVSNKSSKKSTAVSRLPPLSSSALLADR